MHNTRMCTNVVYFLQKRKSLEQLGKTIWLFKNFYPPEWVGFLHQLGDNLRISPGLGKLSLKLSKVSFKTDTVFTRLIHK